MDTKATNFLLGSVVIIGDGAISSISGIIIGKIKDIDAYVVSAKFNIFEKLGYKRERNRCGYPNRNLPLEWGKFKGNDNEFIVSGSSMRLE